MKRERVYRGAKRPGMRLPLPQNQRSFLFRKSKEIMLKGPSVLLRERCGPFQDLHTYLTVAVTQTRRECFNDGITPEDITICVYILKGLAGRLASPLMLLLRYQDVI
jgi:hypothetical protein